MDNLAWLIQNSQLSRCRLKGLAASTLSCNRSSSLRLQHRLPFCTARTCLVNCTVAVSTRYKRGDLSTGMGKLQLVVQSAEFKDITILSIKKEHGFHVYPFVATKDYFKKRVKPFNPQSPCSCSGQILEMQSCQPKKSPLFRSRNLDFPFICHLM